MNQEFEQWLTKMYPKHAPANITAIVVFEKLQDNPHWLFTNNIHEQILQNITGLNPPFIVALSGSDALKAMAEAVAVSEAAYNEQMKANGLACAELLSDKDKTINDLLETGSSKLSVMLLAAKDKEIEKLKSKLSIS